MTVQSARTTWGQMLATQHIRRDPMLQMARRRRTLRVRRGAFDLEAFRDRMDAARVAKLMRAYRRGELETESWADVKADLGL